MSDAIYLVPDSAGGEIRLHVNGADLELYRDDVLVDSRPLAALTSYTINGGDGRETLRIDELIALPGGIVFNAGAPNSPPGDGIVIALGALDGSTVSYTNATDGVITLASGGAVATYRFTGIDPIDMTGSTVGNLVFNLPGSTDTRLEDNGNPVDGSSQLRDADGTPGFDTTTFAHPASSLTIHGTVGDSVTVTLVEALGAADLTIGSLTDAALRPDSIGVDNVVTTGTVVLAASGTITQSGFDPSADVTASALAMLANGGIAIPDIQVATVAAANTGAGSISFNSLGDFAIGTVGGVVGLSNSGGIGINQTGGAAGNLTINSPVISSAGNVFLEAVGPGRMLTSNAAVAAGNTLFLLADRMALAGGTASAGGSVLLSSLTPGTAIDLGAQTDVAAATLELSDAELDTISAAILSIGSIGNGNITVSNPITGGGHYSLLSLTCSGAVIDGTASEQADIASPELRLLAASGIGAADDLDIAAGQLTFFNSLGAVNISNTGPLTLGFSQNTGTTTTVSTTSPLTVSSVSSAGDLTLSAGDSAASGDDLTVLGGTVQSTAGSVILSAGDDLLLNAFANIIAAGNISIAVDAGNADPGVGGTADIRNGTLSAGSISLIGQGDGDTLLGGAAGENFFGGGGDDLIAGGGGNNALNGGLGNDTADYSAAPGAVSINVATGGSNGYGGTDGFAGIESVNGSSFADTLTGDGNANTFRGNGGDDILAGAAGADTAAYSGNAVELGIIFLPGTDMRVVDRRAGSPDGTDALSGFEALQFANGTMPVRFGTSGDDSFTSSPGLEAINAGLGNDTITFNFRLVDATVSYFGNTVTIIGPSGHTVLGGFERFVFTDGTVDNADGDRLVDDLFYYTRYHDVWNAHADADQHFHASGWRESRDPNPFFSTVLYQSAYPDVAAAGVDPLSHFDHIGWREGRIPSLAFSPALYRAANPDVAAAGVDPLAHYLVFGQQEGRLPFAPSELIAANGFDYVWYLGHNPDVAAANVDPLWHFQTVGWREGRNPNALFDTTGYLATYADVAAAQVNPLDHYNLFGWREGRDPSVDFDTTSYRAAYPDVAAAQVNPLTHYLTYGIHEGRSAFADAVWG
jgi:hypothetical protein